MPQASPSNPPVSRPGRGVPIGPVRTHLKKVIRNGGSIEWLARTSGVCRKTVVSVLNARRPSVYRGTADLLLAVPTDPPPGTRHADPGPTIVRVAELREAHWTVRQIARAAGLSPSTLMPSHMGNGVSAATEAAIRRVWEARSNRPGRVPRTYPWLTVRVLEHTIAAAASGAGVSRSSIQRLRAGQPVTRDVARAANTWLARLDAVELAQEAARARDAA